MRWGCVGEATKTGWIDFVQPDGTSQAYIGYGSTSVTEGIQLWARSGFGLVFGANGAEAMRISPAGSVLIGHTAADANSRLLVRATATSTDYAFVVERSTGADVLACRNDGYVFMPAIYSVTTASAANMFINTDGSLLRSTSSERYKTEIRDYDKGLETVDKLRPVYYKEKNGNNTQYAGLIAEEVDAAGLNEFVLYDTEGRPDALHYANMIALLTKAVQELKAELAVCKAKLGE